MNTLLVVAGKKAAETADQGPSTFQTIVTSLVVAAVISGLVSLAAPWTQWWVERRKLRVHRQRQAIRNWRKGIQAWDAANNAGAVEYPASFIKEQWYFSLRRHLTDKERHEFERLDDAITVFAGAAGVWHHFTRLALNAIDRIEKEWKLP